VEAEVAREDAVNSGLRRGSSGDCDEGDRERTV
jgi:hypothetical protein